MAIVTQAQVKTAVGIAGTEYDTQITALIPYVQQFIIDYCKNDFRENDIYVQSKPGKGSIITLRIPSVSV